MRSRAVTVVSRAGPTARPARTRGRVVDRARGKSSTTVTRATEPGRCLDIPRIFNITESAHRIHNPFTSEKLATPARRCDWKREPGVLDLGSGSGEMLPPGTRLRSRRHRYRHEPVVHRAGETPRQGTRCRRSSGVHPWRCGRLRLRRRSVWPPVSAPRGSVGSRRHRRASGAEPAPRRDHPHRRALLAEATADGRRSQGVSCWLDFRLSSRFRNFSRRSATSAMTSWRWFWQTRTAGTDTRRPSGSRCAYGSRPIPATSSRKTFAPD